MKPFKALSGVATPFNMINVDTDTIIPQQFLKTIVRSGLGKHLFSSLRYKQNGEENPDFILNKPAYRNSKIIIAGANFGCGSSREHAVWALADFGINVVIAESFADIFYSNCLKNGLLPIILPKAEIDLLQDDATLGANALIMVDLVSQTISRAGGSSISFNFDKTQKHRLLNGLDDIALTIQKTAAIEKFEENQKLKQPWRK